MRRDGSLLAIADRQRRQENSAASRPPSRTQKEAAAEAAPRTADPDPGEGAKTGGCRPNMIDISRAGTPASQASRGGSASRRRCLRRQLTQMLKEGSECLSPDDVRRIIRAARSGLEGSLTAICMLDNVSLFTHAFPDADDKELRAHCLSTLLEYEESMQAWEEAKDSGELDSDSNSSDDEDELTGSELRRELADWSGPRRFCSRPTWSRALRPRSSETSTGLTGTRNATRVAGNCCSGKRSGWEPSRMTEGRRRSRS